jgi:hypothetical protein
MQTILWLLLGLALGGAFIAYARWKGTGERQVLALGLVVASVIYVVFALAGAGPLWSLIEILGVAVFGMFASLGLHGRALWLAAGWALHVPWDAGLHLWGAGAEFAPAWYPTLCISFDLLVAGYVVARFGRVRTVPE